MTRRNVTFALVAIMGWIALSLTLLFIVAEDTAVPVDCPTEDSCTVDYVIAEYRRITGDTSASLIVDYRDGAWHIEPTVP